jgi:1-acyl-sn-glycerol-3-phosphate acyltransferase
MIYIVSAYVWVMGLIYFGSLCFLSIFFSFFIPQKTLDSWIKRILRIFFKILFIPVEVDGDEKINPDRTYLFMSNHASLFDIPLLEAYIPNYVRGIEARRQFKWPVYGWTIRRLGNISIDRKNIHASIRTMRNTSRNLRRGRSIVVLPEAHRTLDGRLRTFKKLPFYLAKQAETPIVPIGLSGLFYLKHKGSWLIRPAPVKIKFGDIIDTREIRSLSILELRDFVKGKIQNLIEEPKESM